MYKLLIVEDNRNLAQTMADCFDKRLYHIILAFEGAQAYKLARTGHFDIIVIDWILPNKLGTDVIKQLRSNSIDTPCLIISSKNNVQDIVSGLKIGSDGYLCKPFNLLEFKTRVEALLKRPTAAKQEILSLGHIALDPNTMSLRVKGNLVPMRKKEILILKFMLLHKGIALSREQIINNVWSPDEEPYMGSIDVHISRLRKTIDRPFGTNYLKTIHGIGYKIDDVL